MRTDFKCVLNSHGFGIQNSEIACDVRIAIEMEMGPLTGPNLITILWSIDKVQSALHKSDRFYPDFSTFRTELLSPISFLLKCNTGKVST